jgi:UDP-glucose 4-epimerase
VLELLDALNDLGEGDELVDPELAPERHGEVRHSCLEVSRARRELGWTAEVQLSDGLRRTVAGL